MPERASELLAHCAETNIGFNESGARCVTEHLPPVSFMLNVAPPPTASSPSSSFLYILTCLLPDSSPRRLNSFCLPDKLLSSLGLLCAYYVTLHRSLTLFFAIFISFIVCISCGGQDPESEQLLVKLNFLPLCMHCVYIGLQIEMK